jgi:hypothetical protein
MKSGNTNVAPVQPGMKMNLQLFAEPGSGEGNTGEQNKNTNNNGDGNTNQNSGGTAIDYDKIQAMIDKGTQQKENAILKSYFQQQGLTQEEAKQAMAVFKQQKADNMPDVNAMQAQLQQAQSLAQQASLERDATMEAIALGLDIKQVPYILKLTDLSNVTGEDGKVKDGAIKEAINKVLEDFPQLKPGKEENKGFQIGSDGGNQSQKSTDDMLKQAFGL